MQSPMETVLITSTALATLRRLAEEANEPMAVVLERALEAYRRGRYLEALNEDVSALREDPAAWAVEQEERAAWDATLADGLE